MRRVCEVMGYIRLADRFGEAEHIDWHRQSRDKTGSRPSVCVRRKLSNLYYWCLKNGGRTCRGRRADWVPTSHGKSTLG